LGLQVEDACPRLADRPGREQLDLLELEVHAHDGTRSVRGPPVELTVSAIGPSIDQAIALIEHVEMTIRWNRSRCVPSACAMAALMGSAWLTHTIVWFGWACRRRSSSFTIRSCISVKL